MTVLVTGGSTLDRQKSLLGLTPELSLREGVRRVCKRVVEHLVEGEKPPYSP